MYLLVLCAKISAPCDEIRKHFDSSDLNIESPKCFSCFSDVDCCLWMPKKCVTKRRGVQLRHQATVLNTMKNLSITWKCFCETCVAGTAVSFNLRSCIVLSHVGGSPCPLILQEVLVEYNTRFTTVLGKSIKQIFFVV